MRLVDCVQTTLPHPHRRRPLAYLLTLKGLALARPARCERCGGPLRPNDGKVCYACTGRAIDAMIRALDATFPPDEQPGEYDAIAGPYDFEQTVRPA